MIRSAFLFAAALSFLPTLGSGEIVPTETYLNDKCLVSVWAPDSDTLAHDLKWKQKSSFDRLGYKDNAPTADGDALVTIARKGLPGSLLRHKDKLKIAKERAPVVARIETSIFVPDDSGFNYSNAKMPLGIWGGDPGANFCGAGLCPPDEQTGFTVRLTRTRLDRDDRKPPFTHGLRIYSYHLNRGGTVKNPTAEDNKARKRTLKGDGTPMKTPLEPGVWYRVIMDVGLNSFTGDKPNADGWMDAYLLDDQGSILDHAGKTGLIYRRAPDWHIFGPVLTDLWGGDETRPQNLPLADTVIYYEDYEMFLLAPGKTLETCLSR